jgi:hypothetical protein
MQRRTLEYIKNPVYVTEDGSRIDCIIKWKEFAEEHPFTAAADDVEQHGRDIYALLVAGEFGPVAPYQS